MKSWSLGVEKNTEEYSSKLHILIFFWLKIRRTMQSVRIWSVTHLLCHTQNQSPSLKGNRGYSLLPNMTTYFLRTENLLAVRHEMIN